MLVESFVSTQKVSVQKAMGRKLARFVTHQRDYVELLMSALQQLVREELRREAMGLRPQGQALPPRVSVRTQWVPLLLMCSDD